MDCADDAPQPAAPDGAGGSSPIEEFLDATVPVDHPDTGEVLRSGDIEIHGRMPYSSNGTFLVTVHHARGRTQAIYKPERGERPLWDYPTGLWRREVATYELSRALGWGLVPPTVEVDGPLGCGSVQQYVPSDPNQHYFTLFEDRRHHDDLRRMAIFDIVANNCDRKGGHVLVTVDGDIWGIDHGLNFHDEDKLRTVIWDFGGEQIPDDLRDDLVALLDAGLPDTVRVHLSDAEADATTARVASLVASGRLPRDATGRRIPWPLV